MRASDVLPALSDIICTFLEIEGFPYSGNVATAVRVEPRDPPIEGLEPTSLLVALSDGPDGSEVTLLLVSVGVVRPATDRRSRG